MARYRPDTLSMKRSAAERSRRKAAKQAERIRQLEAENAELKARLEKLERLVASLQKNSSTSSEAAVLRHSQAAHDEAKRAA